MLLVVLLRCLRQGASSTPLHYAAGGGSLECCQPGDEPCPRSVVVGWLKGHQSRRGKRRAAGGLWPLAAMQAALSGCGSGGIGVMVRQRNGSWLLAASASW